MAENVFHCRWVRSNDMRFPVVAVSVYRIDSTVCWEHANAMRSCQCFSRCDVSMRMTMESSCSSSTSSASTRPATAAGSCTPLSAINDQLTDLAVKWDCLPTDRKFADLLDENDPLRHFRELFCYPKKCQLPDSKRALTYYYVYSTHFYSCLYRLYFQYCFILI